ncbi:hypothetical protein EDD16DRAFT_1694730 [Pisolithus croceorrhizus]|nr:hypothetical protein EDD16DRAFT_1694730 [Pisolithus croceorrhizus]
MVCHKPSRFMDDDVVLPVSHSDLRLPSRPYFTKRSARVLLILALVSCALVVFRLGHSTRDDASQYLYLGAMEDNSTENGLPPLYESYHDYERHLPQHNLSLPYPEGRDAKFFWAANHVHSSGWGNSMQELLVNALLSHTVNRAFVFDNYTWDPDGPGYSVYNGKLIPSRIPHSAIISGPIIGSSWPPGDPTPRSVSREYFELVCPRPLVIDSYEINKELRLDTSVPASVIFDKWVDRLNSLRDPCVEIKRSSFQIFEIWLFGSSRILSLWPRLSKSPILRNFSWSPLVLQAYAQNAHLFDSPSRSLSFLPSYLRPSNAAPISPAELHNVEPILTPDQTNPVPGLLALHVRRGDFAAHCAHLAKWAADWNGFNKFVALPDKFRPPPEGGRGHTTEENLQLYMKRCFPTIEQITDKVRKVLEEQYSLYGNSRELKRVYVMTNGDQEWLEELKAALMEVKRWDAVVTSRDLSLGWETKPVAQAVDMLVGQRAQVIIGNGFSSLTSNIVMFRMLRELPPEDTRFW